MALAVLQIMSGPAFGVCLMLECCKAMMGQSKGARIFSVAVAYQGVTLGFWHAVIHFTP